MPLRLYSSLTRHYEPFETGKAGEVGLYHCGPTVYHYAHIGNLRVYVFTDILRRTLEYLGFKVRQVINITDVGHLTDNADEGEDKIEEAAKREGKSVQDIARFYTEAFFDDLRLLNVENTGTLFPKASDYIDQQIKLISALEERGFTYNTLDGIYFDTSKLSSYGRLGGISVSAESEVARIERDPQKKNPRDFAVWKFHRGEGKRQQEWNSPWGVGFPGWHTECVAMSESLLGAPFDVHTGGVDHIPIHHNNEIAQAEALFGNTLARYWLHNAFLNFSGAKMAKSKRNLINLKDLIAEGFDPLAFRYFLLTAHYRTPLSFSVESLRSAEAALTHIVMSIATLPDSGTVDENLRERFVDAITDDLNTPLGLALTFEILKSQSLSGEAKKATILDFDRVFGLNLKALTSKMKGVLLRSLPKEIRSLSEEREVARSDKNWQKADAIRKQLRSLGYEVRDTPEGPQILPTLTLTSPGRERNSN